MSFSEKKGDHNGIRNGSTIDVPTLAPPPFKAAETWPEMIRAWPKTTLCIVSNEFCERFSYYGMRTVLTLYLLNVLKFSSNTSTVFFNGFTVLCFTTPLLGSILADGYIGKFKMLDMAGLLIIGFGTGGIKPCVSAFGGDQFELGQERMLSIYFSMFYFSINAGSMISTFITPIFRSQSCMGQDSCYPLAFGIPAVLMIMATLLFLTGSFWYKKRPPKENIFGEVFRVIKREFVDDIKSLFRVMIMLLPVPMFWALYDQQGSRWLIQAVAMDSKLWGSAQLLPDQMQTLNAVLILVFIPVFQVIVYPIVGKCVKITPLRKMVCGGLLTSLAFVITAGVQLRTTLPDIPKENQAFLSFANTFQNCNITIQPPPEVSPNPLNLPQNTTLYDDKVNNIQEVYRVKSGQSYTWNISANCPISPWGGARWFSYRSPPLKSQKSFYIVVGKYGAYITSAVWDKPTEGNGEFSLRTTVTNLALCRHEDKADNPDFPCNPGDARNFYYWQLDYNGGTSDLVTDPDPDDKSSTNNTIAWNGFPNSPSPRVSVFVYKPVRPGSWDLYTMEKRAKDVDHKTPDRTDLPVNFTGISLEIEGQGGVYVLIVTNDGNNNTKSIYQIVPSNNVSILWQVPQIAVLTAAEILFSITGYEFCYSQAAPSMKSLVQALWLLTTAAGDLIIVLVTLLNLFDNSAFEMLFYAGMMLIAMIILALISIFYYEYKSYTKSSTDNDDVLGKDNSSFREDTMDEKPNL